MGEPGDSLEVVLDGEKAGLWTDRATGDGGDIVFRGFRDGVVYLGMKGACSGCPSSTATLRNGIENLLRHFLPQVKAVERI